MEQFLINSLVGLLTLVAAVGGWFARQLWDAVKKLQAELKDLELKVAKDYILYDRLQDALQPLMSALNEIKETLKGKADK